MEIVKLHPISVPSRNKYKLDKLGVGEAAVFDTGEVDISTIRAAASKIAKAQSKKFTVQRDRLNRKFIAYRIA